MFHYYLIGGDTAAPSGLYARLCHGILVFLYSNWYLSTIASVGANGHGWK